MRERDRKRSLRGDAAQSTVEYAVVAAALLAVVVALGLLANALGDGMLAQHAAAAASHHVKGSMGGAVDVFCF